jgi:para-nitrobenzyl esterase
VVTPVAARAADDSARQPIVRTRCGAVRGTFENGIAVFRGIPYAESPVGKLRFRPPARRAAWDGVREATHFGDAPPQLFFNPDDPQPAADLPRGDDYLNLNVWTPDPGGAGLPVMVWITGGGFWWGNGAMSVYDGATFARDGVISVTINYRVHADGFLHLGDRPGSGCFGILDQIAALEWVHENIAAFGGDPARITVIGQSAGALSIGMLLSAPAARGLFQRAILESGATQGTIGADGALIVAAAFLEHAGIRPGDDEAMAQLTTAQLVKAATEVVPLVPSLLAPRGISTDPFGLGLFGGYLPFWPVRGTDVLPVRPIEAVAAGSARTLTCWSARPVRRRATTWL